MPCTAKKFEASHPEMNASGYRDVGIVLTTREVGKLLHRNRHTHYHAKHKKAL